MEKVAAKRKLTGVAMMASLPLAHLDPPGTGAGSTPPSTRLWVTPRAANIKGSAKRLKQGSNHSIESQAKEEWAKDESKRLNPTFVEWLMGLPEGWTASECSATAWTRWWALMRSLLLHGERG